MTGLNQEVQFPPDKPLATAAGLGQDRQSHFPPPLSRYFPEAEWRLSLLGTRGVNYGVVETS